MTIKRRCRNMIKPKGYLVSSGYMGYVEELGRYILFCTEDEYLEYIREGASV